MSRRSGFSRGRESRQKNKQLVVGSGEPRGGTRQDAGSGVLRD